jgi:hypothetical protein
VRKVYLIYKLIKLIIDIIEDHQIDEDELKELNLWLNDWNNA